MAYRQVAQKEKLDLLYRLQLSPQSKTPDTVLEWTELYINSAGIHNLPESLDRCTNVQKISAVYNRLSTLPQSISNLPHLTVLILSKNAFNTFPVALCGLTNLKVLNLSFNKLSDIPVDISRLKVLRIFFLENNAFTTFPIALCGLTNLEGLEMDNNQLSDIPVDITRLKVLRIFYLYNNAFTTFPIALCGLTNLKELNLGGNQLSDIPVDISRLTKLETLHLRGNNITHLPPQMKNMKSLRRLDVDGNPLVQPPIHTVNRGLPAIKRYFVALTDTKAIQSSRIQVNLLGESEAGKTSISHTLQLGQPTLTKVADRTRVVEQGTWETNQDVGFNINDFGRHDVYKIGHPIFISKCGLVFITFDLSKYDTEDKAHYQLYIGHWIDKVQAQMPGIKMAVVGTHIDQDEAYSAKFFIIKSKLKDHRQKKQEWYGTQIKSIEKKIKKIQMNTDRTQTSVVQVYEDKKSKLMALQDQVIDIHDDIFGVSSKTMEGIKELQNYLTTVAKERAVILPEMWIDAATMVCTKKYEGSENTLGWDKLQDLIKQSAPSLWKESNSSNQDLDLATYDILSFLASRGDIIWFDSSPTLKRVVFHKQEVLANVLKAVLNHESDAVWAKLQQSMSISEPKAKKIHDDIFNRGIISREALDCLCEPLRLSTTEVDVMVELMQKLELCYQVQEDESLPSNTSFHFPWLLTEERQPELETKWPSKVPQDTTQLTLQVLFPYKCPEGLYERFSVRQHKYLGPMNTKRMDWKDGVYAEVKKCKMQLTQGAQQLNSDAVSQVPDWFISIAVRGSKLSDMWGVLAQGHHDLMNIIEEDWPGLPYDKYLMCPHCVSENSDHPTLFPGEILDITLGTASKPRQVTCVNTGVYIPADLVYPPHLVMSWQEVLQTEKPILCEKITEPCLKDMLNKFLEEGIITLREDEMVRAEPPQHHDQTSSTRVVCPEKTAVFLDILKTRRDGVFDLLRKCLTENGQSDLASLLR